ncbi:MAG: NnrS family protein, partial [Gammaproteobacteria bacterium]
VPAFLALLIAGNAGMHADTMGIAPVLEGAWRIGLMAVLLLVALIGGRVIPFFSERAIPGYRGQRSHPVEISLLIGIALYCVADMLLPGTIAGYIGLACSLLAAACWLLWLDRRVWGIPLLWVLYLGYGWLVIGLLLLGLADSGIIQDSMRSGVHALAIGCVGTLTIGMMSRVALGHTGRELRAPVTAILAYLLITSSTLVRIVMPWLDSSQYPLWIQLSGLLWALAFTAFLIGYARILWQPRIDGQPG